MNILIVGGAGYLGGAVTDILKDSEHNIVVYDNLLYENEYTKKVPFVYGDVRDTNKLKKYLDWADIVIWIAALVGDQACALDMTLTKEINTDSVKCLINNFKKKIIFTSTCSVYGMADEILDEQSKLNPLSHYANTKLWAEEILKDSNSLIFRLGTLFGVSDEFARLRTDLVLNTLTMNAHAKGKLCVFGGNQWRPLIHVRDVAETICENLYSQNPGIYNLHKENITVLQLAESMKLYFPNLTLEITDIKFEDARNYRVSSDKAIKELNFNPIISLKQGILELKSLLDEQRIKNLFADRYSNFKHLSQINLREIK